MAHEQDAVTLYVDEETARMLERFRGVIQAEVRDAVVAANLLDRTTFRALEQQMSDVERNQSKGLQALGQRLESREEELTGLLMDLRTTMNELAASQAGTRMELETAAVLLDTRVRELGGRVDAGAGTVVAQVANLADRLEQLESGLAHVNAHQAQMQAEVARLHATAARQVRTDRVPGLVPWLIGHHATVWLLERMAGGRA